MYFSKFEHINLASSKPSSLISNDTQDKFQIIQTPSQIQKLLIKHTIAAHMASHQSLKKHIQALQSIYTFYIFCKCIGFFSNFQSSSIEDPYIEEIYLHHYVITSPLRDLNAYHEITPQKHSSSQIILKQ